MCNKLKSISIRIEKDLRIRELRHQTTSLGSKRVVQILPSNRNKRDLLHHLLVPLKLETKVSIMVGVHNPTELDTPSLKVVRRNEVTMFLHVLGVVQPTQVFVVRAPGFSSSVDKKVTY